MLNEMKGQIPFKVPEGYLEGLTSRIMEQLPEKPGQKEPQRVSWSDRVRPWLYLAAVFAGLGWFFKVLVGFMPATGNGTDSLIVKVSPPNDVMDRIQTEKEEDQEYLEYIEAQYADYLMSEEIASAHE